MKILDVFSGKKTYAVALLLTVQAVVGFLLGEVTWLELWNQLPELLLGPGLAFLRKGMAS